jgi:hypothetical protein
MKIADYGTPAAVIQLKLIKRRMTILDFLFVKG